MVIIVSYKWETKQLFHETVKFNFPNPTGDVNGTCSKRVFAGRNGPQVQLFE